MSEKNTNNLILVINAYDEFSKNSQAIESIRCAANRWKSDFLEITKLKYESMPHQLFWNRIDLIDKFKMYDKILFLDSDIIINSKSPNIFDELIDEDLAVVLDCNPNGRFENDWFKNQYGYYVMNLENCVKVFQNEIPNFNDEEYYKNYFNMGVMLMNPKTISKSLNKLKGKIINNKNLYNLLSKGWHTEQNFFNSWLGSDNINIKTLDNKWNWIAPDIADEYDMFMGDMKPWIYHFCGTNLSKERLETYDRWF